MLAAGAAVGAPGVEALQVHAVELGAALGGDLGACEAGLVPRGRQLGLLGRAVAPRLYVAVETEPGYEHAAASVKASVLVTVRGEPDDDASDVVLLGDWRETLPPFAASLSGAL